MKIIKKIDFKCIEINFEYKEQIITIKFEPYRTIDYIKEKVKNKIMELPENIHFYYLGKDLADSDSEKIGNFFKYREKVTIKLAIPNNNHHFNSNSPKKIINHINIKQIDNNFILYNNNSYRYKEIKKEEKKFKNLNKSQNDIKIVNLFQNKKIKPEEMRNIFPTNKSETRLPILKNIFINDNSNKNAIISKKKNISNSELYCTCGRHYISEYCRNCKKFICIECRTEQKHKNHLIIKLNMNNIEKNVKLYGKLIQDDIQKKIEMNRSIFHKSDIPDDNILINKKERIIRKYKEVIKKYRRIMSGIDNKLELEDKDRTTLVINAYNELSQKMNKQLFELLDKLNNNYILKDKKVLFNDLRSFFDEINSKEETLSFLGKDIIKYHLKNEINTKLKSSFDKIDRTLDEIIDDKIPFNLDNKYYEELIKMDIIKHPKNLKNNGEMSNLNTKNEEILTKSIRTEERDNNNNNNDNNNKIALSKFVPKNEINLEKE